MSLKTNIVIVTNNKIKYLSPLVNSILKTVNTKLAIHIVNNGSSDGTKEYLETLKNKSNITIYQNKYNRGIAGGINTALENIVSGHLIILKDTVVISDGWLSKLLNLYTNHDIGAIIPILNEYANAPTEASDCCVFIPEEIYKQLGKFDERFNIGGYEYKDYYYRIVKLGYKLKIIDVLTAVDAPIDEYIKYVNKIKYIKKWESCNQLKIENKYIRDRVAVIITCFNYGQYIDDAVNSILNQTYQNFEIIIVDDASESTTRSAVLKQKYKDPRIQVITNAKNIGVSHSRTNGILASNSEYILVLDGDDKINPKCLELMTNQIHNNDIVYCSRDLFGTYKILNVFDNYSIIDLKSEKRWFDIKWFNVSSMIRRIAFDTVHTHGDPSLPVLEDWDFWLSLLDMGFETIHGISTVLFYYRMHKGSRCSTVSNHEPIKKLIYNKYKQLRERLNTHPNFVPIAPVRSHAPHKGKRNIPVARNKYIPIPHKSKITSSV